MKAILYTTNHVSEDNFDQTFIKSTGVVPIIVKYHVSWNRVSWRHEMSDDAIIFFATHTGQKLTLQRCFC